MENQDIQINIWRIELLPHSEAFFAIICHSLPEAEIPIKSMHVEFHNLTKGALIVTMKAIASRSLSEQSLPSLKNLSSAEVAFSQDLPRQRWRLFKIPSL